MLRSVLKEDEDDDENWKKEPNDCVLWRYQFKPLLCCVHYEYWNNVIVSLVAADIHMRDDITYN